LPDLSSPLTCLPSRFKVEDDAGIIPENPVSRLLSPNPSLLSWACIRLDRLRPGYRFVRLHDPRGRPIRGGKLFVRIEKSFS
jgi:hypothetical protein